MEHLPIFIFEIVLSVFIALVVFVEILLKDTIKQREKIKELHKKIKLRDMQLQELEKFVHSNTEMVSCMAELEPIWYEKDPKYIDSLLESIGNSLVRKMSEQFNERMLERIKELIKNRCYSDFLRTDIISLKPRFKISVPIFRVDYNYIKLADAEYIFR